MKNKRLWKWIWSDCHLWKKFYNGGPKLHIILFHSGKYIFFTARQSKWAQTTSLVRFRQHTQIHHTRQDEWSVRHRDLYLKIHKSQKTPMPAVGFEHEIPACERPQNHALDREATGLGEKMSYIKNNTFQAIFVISWSKFIIKLSSISYVRSYAVVAWSPTTYTGSI